MYANGPISVSTSTFNGNGAGGPAGGFGSTNSGEGEGGAIWQLGGTLSTSNSTLTRNSAGGTSAAGQGGAIFALIPTTLASDTIDANSVGSEDILGAPNAGSGIDARPVTAIATIISGNTGTTNCAERVASSKYSFEGPAGSTTCGLDLPSVDPGLRALADNGGPTQTHALPPTGPGRRSGPGVDLSSAYRPTGPAASGRPGDDVRRWRLRASGSEGGARHDYVAARLGRAHRSRAPRHRPAHRRERPDGDGHVQALRLRAVLRGSGVHLDQPRRQASHVVGQLHAAADRDLRVDGPLQR